MIVPRPSLERLARTVVRRELGRGATAADVAQRITTKLHQELGRLIGPAGFDVLLARALVLARRAHPGLGAVTAGPGGTLAGDGQGEEAAVAIVAHFFEVLAALIGEDLAMRLFRGSWPETKEKEGKQ